MNYYSAVSHPLQVSPLATEQTRQRLVAAIILHTAGTTQFSTPREQHLLDQFKRGRMTIDEVVYYLETPAPLSKQAA